MTIRTTPTQPIHARPWERQSYKIETLNPAGTVLTKEMEVTYSTAFNGELSAVSADVRHESAFAPNAPNPLKNFQFNYDYTEAGDATLLSKRHGPVTDVPNEVGGFKRAYTSTHSYEEGRNGLKKLENRLNVGRVTNPSTMTRMAVPPPPTGPADGFGAWPVSTCQRAFKIDPLTSIEN